MIQTQENGEKSQFGPDMGPLDPKSDCNFFFKNLAAVTGYHGQIPSCKISEKKLMIQRQMRDIGLNWANFWVFEQS